MFEMPDKLKERVVANYKASLLRQIYKIVLQIEGLGNPAGLVRGLGAGWWLRSRGPRWRDGRLDKIPRD